MFKFNMRDEVVVPTGEHGVIISRSENLNGATMEPAESSYTVNVEVGKDDEDNPIRREHEWAESALLTPAEWEGKQAALEDNAEQVA